MDKKIKKISGKTLGIIVGILFLASTVGYFSLVNSKGTDEPEERLREYPVTKGDITAGANGAGTLKLNKVEHSFNENVVIDEIFVKEGQTVKIGDKLASISTEDIDKQLKELNSSLEKAKISLKQVENSKQTSILNNNKMINETMNASKKQYEGQVKEVTSLIKKIENDLNNKINEITSTEKQIEELSIDIELNKIKIDELNEKKNMLITEKEALESQLNEGNTNLANIDAERNTQLEEEKNNVNSNQEINNIAVGDADNSIKLAQMEVDKIHEEIEKVEKLKETPILYATVDGVVITLKENDKNMVMSGVSVVTIGDLNNVIAEVNVNQSDVGKIEEGQIVNLEISAFQDEKFKAKVKSINLKPNEEGNSASYKVTIELDKNDYKLLEGMAANAQFILKEVKDVIMISNKAVTLKDGKQIVQMKNEDGTLREIEIVTGFSDGRSSEVISGLSEGDVVVIGG